MKEIRRITIKTTRRRTLRVQPAPVHLHCPACGQALEMLIKSGAEEVSEADDRQHLKLLKRDRSAQSD